MELELPLDEMSTEEKMLLMENIWDNLRESEDDVPTPDWHETELQDREQSVKNEESEFIDWDKAKQNIRNAIQ